MPKTVPCLWFESEAEQAAEHYVAIFPDSEVTGVTRFGPEDTVVTASFLLDGQEYVALNGGRPRGFTEAVSFQVLCTDQGEVDHYWTRLSEGGEPGRCGWLIDRFGVSWQVVPTQLMEVLQDPDPARAQRATEAMLGMGKLDSAAMRAAADAG